MRELNSFELAAVGGAGDQPNYPQIAVGMAATWAPIQVAGGPAIVNGTVGGVGAGGVVTGVGVMPVALGAAAFTGGYILGSAIEDNTHIGSNVGDAVGTWIAEHTGWQGTFFGW